MKKVSFALVLVMFLFACATSEKYDRKLAGWVGKTESSLVAKWGRPSATRILDNGDKIITYTKANNVYVPSEYYIYNTTGAQPSDTVLYSPFMDNYDFGPYSQTFGYQVEEICQTAFLIQDGIITGWKWRGNDCVARCFLPKRSQSRESVSGTFSYVKTSLKPEQK